MPFNQTPSARWTSYRGWTDETMRSRLQQFMSAVDRTALLEHTSSVLGKCMTISEPFSAGEFWCCFELKAADGALVVARLRLPKHPSSHGQGDDAYAMACEVSTMQFVRARLPKVPIPKVYAFGDGDSEWARRIGAPYMLIEGFYGNTLFDIEPDFCRLTIDIQERIIRRWTAIIAEIATVEFPLIGSICGFSEDAGATLGKLSYAEMDGLEAAGPFESATEYYSAMIDAKRRRLRDKDAHKSIQLAYYVYRDIVQNSPAFKSINKPPFHLNHMDLGAQNILIDSNFQIIAVIDWEFAQSAPLQEHSYAKLLNSLRNVFAEENEAILRDPTHVAHRDVARQELTRQLIRTGLDEAERELQAQGRAIGSSISTALESKVARIRTQARMLECIDLARVEPCTLEMIKAAYQADGQEAEKYLRSKDEEMSKRG